MKTFAPILLVLAASANAANPLKLPTVHGYAVEMPGALILPVNLPGATLSGPMSVPVIPILPIVNATIATKPLILPAALIASVKAAPSVDIPFVIDWSPLDDDGEDGDEEAGALVTADPGPKKPRPSSGANSALRDIALGREPIRIAAEKVFDGRRESNRLVALPHAKIF